MFYCFTKGKVNDDDDWILGCCQYSGCFFFLSLTSREYKFPWNTLPPNFAF